MLVAVDADDNDGLDLVSCNQVGQGFINLPLALSSGRSAAVEEPGAVEHVKDRVGGLRILGVVIARRQPDPQLAVVPIDLAYERHDLKVAGHRRFTRCSRRGSLSAKRSRRDRDGRANESQKTKRTKQAAPRRPRCDRTYWYCSDELNSAEVSGLGNRRAGLRLIHLGLRLRRQRALLLILIRTRRTVRRPVADRNIRRHNMQHHRGEHRSAALLRRADDHAIVAGRDGIGLEDMTGDEVSCRICVGRIDRLVRLIDGLAAGDR